MKWHMLGLVRAAAEKRISAAAENAGQKFLNMAAFGPREGLWLAFRPHRCL